MSSKGLSFVSASSQKASTNSTVNTPQSCSYAAWVKHTMSSSATPYPIFSNRDGSNARGIFMGFQNNHIFHYYQNYNFIEGTSGIAINDGNWHFYVWTFDTTTGRQYIDGVADGSTGQTTSACNTTLNLAFDTDLTRYADIQIDEVAVFNEKLTQNQITNLYNEGRGRHLYKQANVIAGYHLDGDTVDFQNGNNLSLSNSPAYVTSAVCIKPNVELLLNFL